MVRRTGTVLSNAGGRYHVASMGETLTATLRGRVKAHEGPSVLVGDEVALDVTALGDAAITAILPRRSVLQRRMPGKSHGARPVAANIDQVVIVGATKDPDWRPSLMDRFLAVAEANGLPAILVVNKADLEPMVDEVAAPYRAAGYPVLMTSASTGAGLPQLAAHLAERTTLLTGPTGVGKSSLLNRLQPGLALRTGPVGGRSGMGRHTTVAAEMHRFGANGYVVDTPGLRDVGLWTLTPRDVAQSFPDIAQISRACRFDNCRHMEEPDCAVIAAVDCATLAASRLASYRQLLAEALG